MGARALSPVVCAVMALAGACAPPPEIEHQPDWLKQALARQASGAPASDAQCAVIRAVMASEPIDPKAPSIGFAPRSGELGQDVTNAESLAFLRRGWDEALGVAPSDEEVTQMLRSQASALAAGMRMTCEGVRAQTILRGPLSRRVSIYDWGPAGFTADGRYAVIDYGWTGTGLECSGDTCLLERAEDGDWRVLGCRTTLMC